MAKSKFTAKATGTKKAKKPRTRKPRTGRGHGNAWKAYAGGISNAPIPW